MVDNKCIIKLQNKEKGEHSNGKTRKNKILVRTIRKI